MGSADASAVALKTVIPDLTSLGYVLTKDAPSAQVQPFFETWEIVYSGKKDRLIDNIGWPNQGKSCGWVWLPMLYNKGCPDDPEHPGDTNPNKVPLRDIILSLWQSKTGRSVSELTGFWYGMVEEASTVAAVHKAYDAMGLTFDHGERFSRNGQDEGEQEAFAAMMDCVFAIGLSKLPQEYAEFQGRQIESFEISCDWNDDGTENCEGWGLVIHFTPPKCDVENGNILPGS